ncbi:hypothetical protein D3C86_1610880 [compost metagenome]
MYLGSSLSSPADERLRSVKEGIKVPALLPLRFIFWFSAIFAVGAGLVTDFTGVLIAGAGMGLGVGSAATGAFSSDL